jgi:ElaB/YqjD/DUF883 family membrane-anchored ribosome-binding protein
VSGETLESVARAAAGAGASPDDYHYRRELDLNSLLATMQTLARNNPVGALLIAAAVGFLIGRALPKD